MSIDFSPSLAYITGIQKQKETSVEPMKIDLASQAADVSNKDGMFFHYFQLIFWGNGFKLMKSVFRLDISKELFTVRVGSSLFLQTAVGVPFLELFKARLVGAWKNLV